MRFAPIGYLNLLKVHTYLAKCKIKPKINRSKTPGEINKKFIKRQTDWAFISSIVSCKYKRVSLGICANKKVQSVLLVKGIKQDDPASATSNALAKTLGLQGKTIIGDNALKQYINGINAIDLCTEWYKKTNLPFVFATLSVHTSHKKAQQIAKFFPKKVYVPHSKLKFEAQKRDMKLKQAKEYLDLITHKIDNKKNIALKRFWRSVRLCK